MNELVALAAGQFVEPGAAVAVEPLGNGLINDTFLVQTERFCFVLQRINVRVFADPDGIMTNLQHLSRHIAVKDAKAVKLRIPAPILTGDGQVLWRDGCGGSWRALEFVGGAVCRQRIASVAQAAQLGFALAHFHRLCGDLAVTAMIDTLPGFHVTPDYLVRYRTVDAQPRHRHLESAHFCRQFIVAMASEISVLEQAKRRGILHERIIHGDPKVDNFLFAADEDKVVGLIDLDTVKPGLIHYDVGDCLRSCCHVLETNRFDVAMALAILQGYLREAGDFLTEADYDYLYAAIRLIPFELGLRFFTDFLEDNRYFKCLYPLQNLDRAVAQFALCASIGEQRQALEDGIAELRRAFETVF